VGESFSLWHSRAVRNKPVRQGLGPYNGSMDVPVFRVWALSSQVSFWVDTASRAEAVALVAATIPCVATVLECEPDRDRSVPAGEIVTSDGRSCPLAAGARRG
jgi:hypothetical protein